MEKFLQENFSGAVEVHVVRGIDVLGLLVAGKNEHLSLACVGWLRAAARAKRKDAPLCMSCDTAFSRMAVPHALVCLLPIANPTAAIVTGVCDRCAPRSGVGNLVSHVRKLWPDAPVTHPAEAVQ
jgi:hypothetical protein